MIIDELASKQSESIYGENDDFIIRSLLPTFKYPDISLAEFLANKLCTFEPNSVALINSVNEKQRLTYGELHRQAQEFASALLQLGITRQDRVSFCADNSVHYLLVNLAVIYLNILFCPIPPTSGAFELTEQIKCSRATVLVCGGSKMTIIEKALNEPTYGNTMKQLRLLVQVDCAIADQVLLSHPVLTRANVFAFDEVLKMGFGNLLESIPHFPVTNPSLDEVLCCFTSGTTGKPKGVIHTHLSLISTIINCDIRFSSVDEHCFPLWQPLGHISGSALVLYALFKGFKVITFPTVALDPLLATIERNKVKSILLTSIHVAMLAAVDYKQKYDLTSLQLLGHFGSKMATNVLLKVRSMYNFYLMDLLSCTEFLLAVGEFGNFSETLDKQYEPGNLGTLLPNTEMKVIDLECGKALPPNVNGEICFRGAVCFAGYLNDEEATSGAIDAEGWYHTGDVGYYTERGCLFMSDRIKELFKWRLYSIVPTEIENFLYRHDAIDTVCVVGVPHLTDSNLIRAYVQLKEAKSITEQELFDYVKDNMGFQKRLRDGVRFVDTIPRTAIGKVDRMYFKNLVKDELLTEPVE